MSIEALGVYSLAPWSEVLVHTTLADACMLHRDDTHRDDIHRRVADSDVLHTDDTRTFSRDER